MLTLTLTLATLELSEIRAEIVGDILHPPILHTTQVTHSRDVHLRVPKIENYIFTEKLFFDQSCFDQSCFDQSCFDQSCFDQSCFDHLF